MKIIFLKWYSIFKLHILIWFLYMLYEIVSFGIIFNNFKSPIIFLSHYLIVILLFYIHADVVIKWTTKNRKTAVWLTAIFVVAELALYIFAQHLVNVFLVLIGFSSSIVSDFNMAFILRNLYRGVLFMGFSTGYFILRNYLNERKKTAELEKEKLEKIIQQQRIEQELVIAQNAFLKAQINPHFLFNTLDFIYHKVNMHSAIAGEAVIKLAHMMRFAIDSDEIGNDIFLADEIEQVENLIYLYQIRKDEDLNIHFSYAEAVKELSLIPLVILTLVENIFKHGDISDSDEIAFINLEIKDGFLRIQTINLINSHKIKNSNHSGLNNIQKRLTYAYGEKVFFNYETENSHFKVIIEIPVYLLKVPI